MSYQLSVVGARPTQPPTPFSPVLLLVYKEQDDTYGQSNNSTSFMQVSTGFVKKQLWVSYKITLLKILKDFNDSGLKALVGNTAFSPPYGTVV
jgi:hypothetical protein